MCKVTQLTDDQLDAINFKPVTNCCGTCAHMNKDVTECHRWVPVLKFKIDRYAWCAFHTKIKK